MVDRRKQGDIGVAAALLYYTKLGYIVSLPTTEATRYDLIVDKEGTLFRVQCKTSNYAPKGRYKVALTTSGGNRSGSGRVTKLNSAEIDLVFIWCGDDSIWEFPSEVLEDRREVTLSDYYAEYHLDGPKPSQPKPPQPKASSRRGRPCLDCGGEASRGASRCKHCSARSREVIVWPAPEDLQKQVNSSGYRQVAADLGVSDNAVRKRLQTHN